MNDPCGRRVDAVFGRVTLLFFSSPLDATWVTIFEQFRDLQILDLELQDRLDAAERLPEPRPTQNLQLAGPVQRLVVLASCKPRHPNVLGDTRVGNR